MKNCDSQSSNAVLAKRQVGDFILTEYYRPGMKLARHSHRLPYFNLVLEGGYERVSWGLFRGLVPLTDEEFSIIASNVAPYLR